MYIAVPQILHFAYGFVQDDRESGSIQDDKLEFQMTKGVSPFRITGRVQDSGFCLPKWGFCGCWEKKFVVTSRGEGI